MSDPGVGTDTGPLVKVENLRKLFPVSKSLFREAHDFVHAVDDISFEIQPGESLGLVGESGCGKSTTGRMMTKLTEATSGQILLADEGEMIDIAHIQRSHMRRFRRRVQMIFQDPFESLNPRRTVYDTVAESLTVQRIGSVQEREGGQRQRVAIARALVIDPTFVVADEPTSMLDVSIRISIMDLMLKLADEFGVSYLYITHDLAVARYMCDRIAVMYLGKIVEIAPTEELLSNPQHPYTQALLSAVPVPDPAYKRERVDIKGGISKALNPPPVCRFIERCPRATDQCRTSDHPGFDDLGNGHLVACYNL
jgi:peptide/nickel transport system ATP-binding protein